MGRKAWDDPKEGLSLKAYARWRKDRGLPGGSQPTITKALKEGRIKRTLNGRIDPYLCDKMWEENSRARRTHGETEMSRLAETASQLDGKDADTFLEALESEGLPSSLGELADLKDIPKLANSRAVKELYTAAQMALKYSQMKGDLVPATQAREAGFNLGRRVRDKLWAIPARVCSKLAAMKDPREIRKLLEDEFELACSDFPKEDEQQKIAEASA